MVDISLLKKLKLFVEKSINYPNNIEKYCEEMIANVIIAATKCLACYFSNLEYSV